MHVLPVLAMAAAAGHSHDNSLAAANTATDSATVGQSLWVPNPWGEISRVDIPSLSEPEGPDDAAIPKAPLEKIPPLEESVGAGTDADIAAVPQAPTAPGIPSVPEAAPPTPAEVPAVSTIPPVMDGAGPTVLTEIPSVSKEGHDVVASSSPSPAETSELSSVSAWDMPGMSDGAKLAVGLLIGFLVLGLAFLGVRDFWGKKKASLRHEKWQKKRDVEAGGGKGKKPRGDDDDTKGRKKAAAVQNPKRGPRLNGSGPGPEMSLALSALPKAKVGGSNNRNRNDDDDDLAITPAPLREGDAEYFSRFGNYDRYKWSSSLDQSSTFFSGNTGTGSNASNDLSLSSLPKNNPIIPTKLEPIYEGSTKSNATTPRALAAVGGLGGLGSLNIGPSATTTYSATANTTTATTTNSSVIDTNGGHGRGRISSVSSSVYSDDNAIGSSSVAGSIPDSIFGGGLNNNSSSPSIGAATTATTRPSTSAVAPRPKTSRGALTPTSAATSTLASTPTTASASTPRLGSIPALGFGSGLGMGLGLGMEAGDGRNEEYTFTLPPLESSSDLGMGMGSSLAGFTAQGQGQATSSPVGESHNNTNNHNNNAHHNNNDHNKNNNSNKKGQGHGKGQGKKEKEKAKDHVSRNLASGMSLSLPREGSSSLK